MTKHRESKEKWQRTEQTSAVLTDRRRFCRTGLDGVATAFELKGNHFGEIHTLAKVDYSESGLGANTPEAVPCGTYLSIGFQDPGHGARFGAVIRCERQPDGYRLGVCFE